MVRRAKQNGFTLVELMIVMAIILILVSVSIPMYNKSIQHARESALRQNLYHLRQAIDQYTMDKQKAPQSLDELVSAKYLREIPVDPMTQSRDTWVVDMEDIYESIDQNESGISDVHSGAQGVADDGTAYSTW